MMCVGMMRNEYPDGKKNIRQVKKFEITSNDPHQELTSIQVVDVTGLSLFVSHDPL